MPYGPLASTGGAPGMRSAAWFPRPPGGGGGEAVPRPAPREEVPAAAVPDGSPLDRPAARPSTGTPSPGSPTRLRNPGPARPKLKAGAAAVADASSFTIRVAPDVIPPAHSGVGAGNAASNCLC